MSYELPSSPQEAVRTKSLEELEGLSQEEMGVIGRLIKLSDGNTYDCVQIRTSIAERGGHQQLALINTQEPTHGDVWRGYCRVRGVGVVEVRDLLVPSEEAVKVWYGKDATIL